MLGLTSDPTPFKGGQLVPVPPLALLSLATDDGGVTWRLGASLGEVGLGPLFFLENTRMLFGDAKATLDEVLKAI